MLGVAASNKFSTVFSCACSALTVVERSMAGAGAGTPRRSDAARAEETRAWRLEEEKNGPAAEAAACGARATPETATRTGHADGGV